MACSDRNARASERARSDSSVFLHARWRARFYRFLKFLLRTETMIAIQNMFKNVIILLPCCLIFYNADAMTNPFKLLWGKTAPTEIIFAPFGLHLFDPLNQQYISRGEPGMVNDAQYLLSLHWKSITIGTFTNSYRDQVEFLGLYRQIVYLKRFDLAYLVGVMTGYGKNAQNNGGPSFTHTIVAHDPGLIIALDTSVPLTKKIAFHMVLPIDFRSIDFGVGYTFF